MIHRCETCPMWQRRCNDKDYAHCEAADSSRFATRNPKSLAFAISSEDEAAILVTHKAFGCVMHPMNKAIA